MMALALPMFALTAAAGTAQAHEVRFIASYGNNANLCTRAAPCLTLQRGINRTPAGGELIILDSGDYGNNGTIRRSITISAIGVSATLGGPITIDNADATVVLRGLRLNGAGADANADGIYINAAASVHIENCEIQGFGSDGIQADAELFVFGSVSRNNGGTGLVFGTGGPLVVDNSRFERNGVNGLSVLGSEATITRTIVSGNQDGITLINSPKVNVTWTTAEHNDRYGYYVTGESEMTLEQSVARGNLTGLQVASGTARISSSVVTNNGTGISVGSTATLLTRVNNTVSGNTTNVSGTVTPLGGI
jgi:nitrous oxidase accessory protein NosD